MMQNLESLERSTQDGMNLYRFDPNLKSLAGIRRPELPKQWVPQSAVRRFPKPLRVSLHPKGFPKRLRVSLNPKGFPKRLRVSLNPKGFPKP